MGDMTVDELKDKKLWFLWSAKPGRNGKVTKEYKAEGMLIFHLPYIIIGFAGCIKNKTCRILITPDLKN